MTEQHGKANRSEYYSENPGPEALDFDAHDDQESPENEEGKPEKAGRQPEKAGIEKATQAQGFHPIAPYI